jgi:GT2 family glycosyltransferase
MVPAGAGALNLLGRSMGAALKSPPLLSIILATHNRRPVLLETLRQLEALWPKCGDIEILVVDNASRDGTAEAVRKSFPDVRLFALRSNHGAVAKNVALSHVRGQYILFLDDDSYPTPLSLPRMLAHNEADPRLGAAVFQVTLPDGSHECSAYPDVFIGCGTAFRRRALDQVGGLPHDFFMQAEEYDLSLRLLDAGWRIRRFENLEVSHLKTPGARRSDRVMRFDTRNNLLLILRHFPLPWVPSYALDWMRRYAWIAQATGRQAAFRRGLLEGLVGAMRPSERHPISPGAFEQFAKIEQTRRRLRIEKKQHGLKTVLLVDCGKNLLAYWHAARSCGLRVIAIADPRLAAPGRHYRGLPVVDDEKARRMIFDAAIVSNLSPVHAATRAAHWRGLTTRPVIDLFDHESDERYALNAPDGALTAGAVQAVRAVRRTVARSA